MKNPLKIVGILAAASLLTISCNKTDPTSTPILLSGKFSVSANKQVQFTRGNLYWNGSDFHIEANQTAVPKTWSSDHVGHFYWSKTASVAYAKTYSDGGRVETDPFFCGEANAMKVDGQSSLYALSTTELAYLFNTRTNGINLFRIGVSITTSAGTVENCVVIAPDGYAGTIAESYTAEAWSTAESAGLVCLPAAGEREDSELEDANEDGNYWAATPHDNYNQHACYLSFDSIYIDPEDVEDRSCAFSVRLVSTVSK